MFAPQTNPPPSLSFNGRRPPLNGGIVYGRALSFYGRRPPLNGGIVYGRATAMRALYSHAAMIAATYQIRKPVHWDGLLSVSVSPKHTLGRLF